ncbi:MAG: type II toxin-antitoxin system RelB/DinJ family antitoxin [Bacteroidales bacterium]|nr:type II toxin-antitoxin system RelB/DinJ family antitoxin [Bacteroidales bacterium]
MAQTAMTVRLDQSLKEQFDALCNEFGMSANTAFTIFARTVVRRRMIPFAIEAPAKEDSVERGKAAFDEIRAMVEKGEIPSLTLDEIEEEIRKAREGK